MTAATALLAALVALAGSVPVGAAVRLAWLLVDPMREPAEVPDPTALECWRNGRAAVRELDKATPPEAWARWWVDDAPAVDHRSAA